MKVWWFGIGNGTYSAHFQVLIAEKIDIENRIFAHFEVVITPRKSI